MSGVRWNPSEIKANAVNSSKMKLNEAKFGRIASK
jgi:hypothetical protein